MKKSMVIVCGMFLVLGLTEAASPHLIDRGGGLIYDTCLDITWLQTANYAGTTMDWDTATDWASELEYYDPVRGFIWDDWRLPYAKNVNQDPPTGPDFGAVSSSEVGHIYYYGYDEDMKDYVNFFTNIFTPGTTFFWSAEQDSLDQGRAWAFCFSWGTQSTYVRESGFSVWAVRDGDVAVIPDPPSVPEPASILLLASGLAGIVGVRRRFRRK